LQIRGTFDILFGSFQTLCESHEEEGGDDVELLTIKELLETGVHFGHRVRKWNPKMREFIYAERKGIHIIDLEKTIKLFEEAYYFVRDQIAQGKEIMFVGTKRQVQDTIEEEAKRCGPVYDAEGKITRSVVHYVNRRWLGGTLTNFKIIKNRIERMKELEEMANNGLFERLPPQEAMNLRRDLMKLQRNLNGLRFMERPPDLLYAVDTIIEKNAIHEAKLLGIPVIAIVDTNCDPDPIDFPIPGNDDAIKATKLITSRLADAVLEGKEGVTAAAAKPAEHLITANEGREEPQPTMEEALKAELAVERKGETNGGLQ